MKRRKRKKNSMFVLVLLFCALAMVQYFFQQQQKPQEPIEISESDALAGVKKYTPLVEEELKKVQLEDYTHVLIAVMQQESHGQGGDPMQASESAGLPPNSIKDPKQSIQAGVKHFQHVLTYGNQKKVDFPTIIQAYNMGPGYIDFIANHGGKHSEELAKQFSSIQVEKNPTLYNCRGDKNNFRYPYCYGDFTYNTKVQNNIRLLADSVPVTGDGETYNR